ncbi:MAG TPA: hypothetical protein VIL99_07370 [Ignavibacteria bacterium]
MTDKIEYIELKDTDSDKATESKQFLNTAENDKKILILNPQAINSINDSFVQAKISDIQNRSRQELYDCSEQIRSELNKVDFEPDYVSQLMKKYDELVEIKSKCIFN